ncbi:kinase-like domain-containing protein [Irpex lacteus]|nr:kinase-like domain-containing protein [Irpex lacteus]
MARKVVSPFSVCVSAALAFVAPVVLYTAGVFLQSVLFSDAARSLVFMALSRLYFFVLPAYVAFSHSWLARALQVLAFYCSWSLSIPCLVSSSLSSVKVALGGPLPGLSSFSLPPLSTSDFSIFLPRLHLHDLVDKTCQWALRIVTPLRLLVSLLSVAQRVLGSIMNSLYTAALLFFSLLSFWNVLVLFLTPTAIAISCVVYSLIKTRGISLVANVFRTKRILKDYGDILFVWTSDTATCCVLFAHRHRVKLLFLAGAIIGWTFFFRDCLLCSQSRAMLSSRIFSLTSNTIYSRYMASIHTNMALVSPKNQSKLLLGALALIIIVSRIVVIVHNIPVTLSQEPECAVPECVDPPAHTNTFGSVHPWFPAGHQLHPEFAAKYELGKGLGRGAFGFVIQARRRSDGRQFAVKFLGMELDDQWPSIPEYGRVPLEVVVGLNISHENIIGFVEHFKDDEQDGYCYVVYELFGDPWQRLDPHTYQPVPGSQSGHSLKDYLAQHGKMPLDNAYKVITQLVSALTYLHSKGIAHCDIKPDNILIDRDANIRLIDLGNVVHKLRCSVYPTNPVEIPAKLCNGTLVYAPPEAQAGSATCQPYLADVWSLGAMLYELVTGVLPFVPANVGGRIATMRMIRRGVEGLQGFDEHQNEDAVVEVLPLLRMCLELDLSKRITMTELALRFDVSL